MIKEVEVGTQIIDTLDASSLLDKKVNPILENVEFYTKKKTYNRCLSEIKLEEDVVLW